MNKRILALISIIVAIPLILFLLIPAFGVVWWQSFDPRTSTENKLEPTTSPKIIPESEERFEGKVRIKGEMADKICKIVGSDCTPYYIGNPQPDGSIMVGITISDAITEKQFVFLIKNGTLSYEVMENEN